MSGPDAGSAARRAITSQTTAAYSRAEVTAVPVDGACRHGDLGATEAAADVRIWSGTSGGPIALGPTSE